MTDPMQTAREALEAANEHLNAMLNLFLPDGSECYSYMTSRARDIRAKVIEAHTALATLNSTPTTHQGEAGAPSREAMVERICIGLFADADDLPIEGAEENWRRGLGYGAVGSDGHAEIVRTANTVFRALYATPPAGDLGSVGTSPSPTGDAGGGADLTTPYTPRVIHYPDADALEFVERDVPTVAMQVYCGLDLLHDMKTGDVIGWRISDWSSFNPEPNASTLSAMGEGWTDDDLEPAARELFQSVFPEETWEDCPGLHDDVFASLRAAISKLPLPAPPAPAEGGE